MAKSQKSRYAVLGILAMNPKSSGYDIKKTMEESTQYFWKESFSSIYPMLEELEREGLVEHVATAGTGKRQSKLFSLTKRGHATLQGWLVQPFEQEQGRNEFLLKIFFGNHVDMTVSREHIGTFREDALHKEKVLLHIKDKLKLEHQKNAGLPYWLLTVEMGLIHAKAMVAWCDFALGTLAQTDGEQG